MHPSAGDPDPTVARSDEPAGSVSPRASFSIFLKLLVVILSLVLGVASLVAGYLLSHQVREMQTQLETKAATYGRLTSKEVASAIAFGDRETAREAFDSLAEDDDIESLTLFTAQGNVLHARGVVSRDLPVDVRHVTRVVSFAVPGRVGVVVPVVSIEGPRGALAVELSTRRLAESRAQVLSRAVLACILAAVAGALGAFLIARSLARRVRAIATVANAVAAGDLSQSPVPYDGTRDEIGVTAVAFNAMLHRLQALIAQITQSAHEEQSRLETLVQARTAELALRNGDMRRVLDNVGQGFITVDRDGKMGRERSAILETWLGPAPESGLLFEYLARVDPTKAQWLEVCWESLLDGLLPLQVCIGQLPARISNSTRHFELEYRPLLDAEGELERVVVVLSDVTAEVDRARAETDEREATRLFKRLIADRTGFLEFFAEARALVDDVSKSDIDQATQRRALHTLKGNALVYGVDSIAQLAHALEDRLAEEGTLRKADLAPLAARWTDVSSKIGELVGEERHTLEVDDPDYWKMFGAIERRAPHSNLRDLLLSWRLEPTEARLQRIAEQAAALAARLGKGPISVTVESNDLRLARERWSPFWSAAVHVVRNAIDHGLEQPDERSLLGKPAGRLELRTFLQGDSFVIEFADDGRGIDWAAVQRKATAIGAPTQTQASLVDALCIDGLSTKDSVTELSGRGVGLGAVRRACQELGGKMEVSSTPGRGTTVRFVWPAKVLTPPAPRVPRASRPPSPSSVGLGRAG